jgi:hypothetical protein
LRGEGGIKALLGMVKCGHPDVLAQVARGIANFAKCESRAATQGNKTFRPRSERTHIRGRKKIRSVKINTNPISIPGRGLLPNTPLMIYLAGWKGT